MKREIRPGQWPLVALLGEVGGSSRLTELAVVVAALRPIASNPLDIRPGQWQNLHRVSVGGLSTDKICTNKLLVILDSTKE